MFFIIKNTSERLKGCAALFDFEDTDLLRYEQQILKGVA